MEDGGVLSLPVLLLGSSTGGRESPSFSKTSGFLSSGGKTTKFTVFVDWLGDPLDFRMSSDGLVEGIDKDNLEELVGGVLSNPVRVQNSEGTETTASSLLIKNN